MSGAELAALLDHNGFDFYTGVPCSLVADLIAALECPRSAPWIPAVREDVALGLAAGAWLGGRRPVVVMQNSGLGTGLNALASLSLMYGLPALLIVTWRGFRGQDAPEHLLMGEISPKLLDLLGIPYRILRPESADELLAWAREEMDARETPVAILVPPGVVATGAGAGGGVDRTRSREASTDAARPDGAQPPPSSERAPRGPVTPPLAPAPVATMPGAADEELRPVISRREALAVAVKELGDEPVIHANGYVCRESFATEDRPQNFYMIGSMGLASAIGLGLALVRPARPCVVFDGDGNLLMSLGTLAMVGGLGPLSFLHLVFDNEVYGSTGGQRSPSREVRLDRLALSAGYRTATAATTPDEIAAALRSARLDPGPHFILVKVTTMETPAPRIPHTPRAIRDRFRQSLRVE
ncbi:MAG: phosphonopyruvate decarboxylase [Candidatus Rokuibacteriota bacterium]|nr:MAG: phosphonopyruvate decarboxylase [Candidatus Rokubacteria bacterium]